LAHAPFIFDAEGVAVEESKHVGEGPPGRPKVVEDNAGVVVVAIPPLRAVLFDVDLILTKFFISFSNSFKSLPTPEGPLKQ